MEQTEENGPERDTRFKPGNKAAANRGPNKVSAKVKESIVNFLENNVDKIQESFDQLGPKGKLEFIADILPYAAPKLSSVQVDQNTNHSGGITIRWKEPNISDSKDESQPGEL